ncbi:MAG: hypothetical protein NT051_03170 [Candidatus Micrarchaeota archaeon]|nr:hypothetical protein [Candidatus Micrarchaeota archaeon]
MEKINVDFKNTCRILFGKEIGELEEFGDYLREAMFAHRMAKSSVSGKQVMLSSPFYPQGARVVSQEELPLAKFAPISINDIKDVDTLFEAAQERAVFCGNKTFGATLGASEADNCADCANAYHSHDIYNVKNCAYCSNGRISESVYGVSGFCRSSHSMRCVVCAGPGMGVSRCFEVHSSAGTSGSYFSYNCSGCSDLMFCFNLRGKSNCIGNLQLSRERYSTIRAKLVSEMAQKLRKDKRLFSLVDLAEGDRCRGNERVASKLETLAFSPMPPTVRRAFESCCRVVLGSQPSELERYCGWLAPKAARVSKVKGFEGEQTFHADFPLIGKLPACSLASLGTALSSPQKRQISISEGETPGLEEIAGRAGKIALFTFEKREGRCLDISETAGASDAVGCHRLLFAFTSSLSGLSSIVTESKYIFGGYLRMLNSEFCISCFNLTQCKGCLEADSSYRSSGLYFCHNCEDVENGILCFNLKGARYAVLNQPVGKEEFARVKKMLLEYINRELEEKGELGRSIFELEKTKR